MRLLIGFALVIVGLISPAIVIADSGLTFERDVRPLLKAHCFHCHGEAGLSEGELDLRLRRWIIAGGDSGTAVHPGDPDASLLLQRVLDGEMPPGETKLSDAETGVLREWIAEGAVTARDEPELLESGDYFTEEERSFWSFQPIRRPSVPDADDPRLKNPVDAFVFDRLRRSELDFSEQADRATLIRRLAFDLWGLPPDPGMVEAFVGDEHPMAYENLVDRLLASPRYGERWGRHWLDVAGYADSDGFATADREREFAYFYRDYVIDSTNADKPLDQFICEQLAGDELAGDDNAAAGKSGEGWDRQRIERLAATGFLRMAPDGTGTGGVDVQEAANENIADTINIVSTSLLGLTVGCARCHDHRYDPISQLDYYRLRAVFAPALDWKQWKKPSQRRVSLYSPQDKQQRAKVEAEAKQAEEARRTRQQEHIDRTLFEELLVVPDHVRDSLRAAFRAEKAKRTDEQVGLLEEYPSVGNISPGSLYLYAQQRSRRAGDIEKAAQQREDRYIKQAREIQLASVPAEIQEPLRKTLDANPADRSESQQTLATQYEHVFVTATSLKDVMPEAAEDVRQYRQAALVCRQQDAKTELAKLAAEIAAIRAEAPKERFLRVLTEPADHAPPTFLFVRGDHNQPGKQVEPNELTVLNANQSIKIPRDDAGRATTGRRLAYAKHLTSGSHPLLARVLVNRVWLHHFGRGLVATPGDFGSLGAAPTHPELLDWLASELMDREWSLKQVHRLIVLSTTYQQSSRRSSELDRVDPQNRLLARMSVRRLESEAVRDAMLVASGMISNRMHGEPVPVREDKVGQIVLGKEMLDGERKPSGAEPEFEGMGRRSLYVQVRRSRPLAVLETFDLATVSPNCVRRNYSNVATQSLFMLNSAFVINRAEQLADRIERSSGDLRQQLQLGWRICFSRSPSTEVLVDLLSFVDRQTSVFQARDAKLSIDAAQHLALATACQAMLSSNQFIYID
ncbi:MAG: PSD1 and planctomycete cytochrome C domain-containing protein [Rubripirellula sp.]|nr:PSD1 and planctomycete cytochrome C domain-containing protein [Rubripirellula sp.]